MKHQNNPSLRATLEEIYLRNSRALAKAGVQIMIAPDEMELETVSNDFLQAVTIIQFDVMQQALLRMKQLETDVLSIRNDLDLEIGSYADGFMDTIVDKLYAVRVKSESAAPEDPSSTGPTYP